jgi:hypothetical protein
MKSNFGWFEMSDVNHQRWEKPVEHLSPAAKDIGQVANDLCEKALNDAKAQLHPLLRSMEVERLGQRREFLQAFKAALERRIARRLAAWQPAVQAVFKFDETWTETIESWDGSIHLLVKVPRLSNAVKALGKALDKGLVQRLNQLGWSRFRKRQSILEIQQVTSNELRHGVSYGAMFCAVYNAPVKVWPQERATR